MYVNRPLDTMSIAGRDVSLCGRCSKRMSHLVEWLAARRLAIVAIDQRSFELSAPVVVERNGMDSRARRRF